MSEEKMMEGGVDAEKPKRPQGKKADKYKNCTATVFYVFGHRVAPGETYKPTAQDKKDERGRKKLDRAVEMGFIEKV